VISNDFKWISRFEISLFPLERLRICCQNLAKFRNGAWRLCDIITGDKTWIYHRQIGRKSSNATWVSENEPPRIIVRRNRFESKTLCCLFFKSSGPVLIHKVYKGETIDHNYYIENCLKPVINEAQKQEKSLSTKYIKLLHDRKRVCVVGK
jgi:hypothetical protein